MIITGLLAILVKELLASIVLFSAFSFYTMLIYLALGAPDVAFMEAIIGIVATTFFMVVLTQIREGDQN
jgi:uncharacterized MnhB-related membrane protein